MDAKHAGTDQPIQEIYGREEVMRLLCTTMNAATKYRKQVSAHAPIIDVACARCQVEYMRVAVYAASVYLDHYEDQDISELRALADDMKEIVKTQIERIPTKLEVKPIPGIYGHVDGVGRDVVED